MNRTRVVPTQLLLWCSGAFFYHVQFFLASISWVKKKSNSNKSHLQIHLFFIHFPLDSSLFTLFFLNICGWGSNNAPRPAPANTLYVYSTLFTY